MIAVLVTTICAVALGLFFKYMPPSWLSETYYRPCAGGWAESAAHGCDTLTKVPQQPINTWSNLAYIYQGWDTGDPVFASVMTVMGLSSALYHGTSTSWAGKLDVSAMYATLSYLIMSQLTPSWYALLMAGIIWVASMWTLRGWWYWDLNNKIGLGFAGIVVTGVLLHGFSIWPQILIGAVIFGIAYLCWQLDHKRKFPWLMGHGVWHGLTATGFRYMWQSLVGVRF